MVVKTSSTPILHPSYKSVVDYFGGGEPPLPQVRWRGGLYWSILAPGDERPLVTIDWGPNLALCMVAAAGDQGAFQKHLWALKFKNS